MTEKFAVIATFSNGRRLPLRDQVLWPRPDMPGVGCDGLIGKWERRYVGWIAEIARAWDCPWAKVDKIEIVPSSEICSLCR